MLLMLFIIMMCLLIMSGIWKELCEAIAFLFEIIFTFLFSHEFLNVLLLLGGIALAFYLRSINSVVGVILVCIAVTWFSIHLDNKMNEEEQQEKKNKIIEELKRTKDMK